MGNCGNIFIIWSVQHAEIIFSHKTKRSEKKFCSQVSHLWRRGIFAARASSLSWRNASEEATEFERWREITKFISPLKKLPSFYYSSQEKRDHYSFPWLPQVRKKSGKKKILQGQGKVREFHFESGKIYFFEKSQGKVLILRVLIYLLPSQWYVKELSIHVHCVCLAESINKRVERMAVRGVGGHYQD